MNNPSALISAARDLKTLIRTAKWGAQNCRRVLTGRMSLSEVAGRAKQTALAALSGETAVRQAVMHSLDHPSKTLPSVLSEFGVQEQASKVMLGVLLGGYERLDRTNPLTIVFEQILAAGRKEWQLEMFKDLRDGIISFEDWDLMQRLTTIGQGEAVFSGWQSGQEHKDQKASLFTQIRDLDTFIRIESYQERVEHLLQVERGEIKPDQFNQLSAPTVIDLCSISAEDYPGYKIAMLTGLKHLKKVAFAAVVGGTAERMKFVDAEGKLLPQATYPILPVTGQDVFSLFAQSLISLRNLHDLSTAEPLNEVPYDMMTNPVTDAKIMRDFEDHGFFGLGSSNVGHFIQTMVPVVSSKGQWLRSGLYQLNTKPHGHGDFWLLYTQALAGDLKAHARKKVVILQGSNPFAWTNMLAFIGYGFIHNANFGFATVPREVGAPEGAIVLAHNPDGTVSDINVEYNLMQTAGLSDTPTPTGYSAYPGNMNLLLGDMQGLSPLIQENPFYGELINTTKLQLSFVDGQPVPGGRGEAQMQGIASGIKAQTPEALPVIVLNGPRGSDPNGHFEVFKNEAGKKRDTVATCQQFLSDQAARRLIAAGVMVEHSLTKDTGDHEVPTTQSKIELSPAFFSHQDILNDRIIGGQIAQGSSLYLSGFHSRIADLSLTGSLNITVVNETGDMELAKKTRSALVIDPSRSGKVKIKGLTVKNQGNDGCSIIIKGNGELEVEPGTSITGAFNLIVEDGEKAVLTMANGVLAINKTKIEKPTWHYTVIKNEDPQTTKLFGLKMMPN